MNHYVIKRFFARPCRKAAWTFVVLATLTTTACVDEDNAAGNGKKGVSDAVRFNVTDGQAEASAKRAAGLTRSIMPEPVAASVFETKVLPTDNPDYQVVQTTVEGVNPVTPTPGTRAVVAWTRGRFSSTGMNGTSQTAMTNQWFDSEPTQGDGTLDNLHRWTWQKPWGRFFAVYPEVTNSYSKIALSPAGHLPTPYVDFEVEANVQNMKDLMIARSNDAQYVSQGDAPATSLQFQHALTAVKFSVGDNLSLGTITKIEITGALSKGRYTMSDMPIAQGTWAYSSTDRSQVNSLDGVSIAVSQTPNAAIAGTDGRNYTFYMLPQQLDGQNVKAMIYYTTPDNKKHKLTIRLKGQWEAGTTSEYKLSQSNSNWQYHFTVTDNNLTFEHTVQPADVQHYKVTSWRESGAVKQAVPWTVTKYEEYNPTTGQWTDMGPNSWPTWLLNFTYNGPGDANGAANVGNVNLYAVQMRNHLKEYNDALKNATPKGNAGYYHNLANPNDGGNYITESANSYLISAPGHYRIPLVYGNGVKNNVANSSAYVSSAPVTPYASYSDVILHTFLDHNNQPITSPFINVQNSGNKATQASIVWSDQPDLITIGSSPIKNYLGVDYVEFEVPKGDDTHGIRSGNAVIAVKNAAGTVMWSWHLWFAKPEALNTIACTNHQGYIYKFTQNTLGYAYLAWEETPYAQDRKCRVTLQPTAGNTNSSQKGIVYITLKAYSKKEDMATLYEFGRKDAFPGTDAFYPNSNSFSAVNGTQTIGTAIQNPGIMYYAPFVGFYTKTYFNLWSANNAELSKWENDNVIVKTVYDPCPAGFRMPQSNAFTGFTTTGGDVPVSQPERINKVGGFDRGYTFKTSPSSTNTIYFPALSYRYTGDGTLKSGENKGSYWTAAPSNDGVGMNAFYFYFDDTWAIFPYRPLARSYGFNVRPVADFNPSQGATTQPVTPGGVIEW